MAKEEGANGGELAPQNCRSNIIIMIPTTACYSPLCRMRVVELGWQKRRDSMGCHCKTVQVERESEEGEGGEVSPQNILG